MSEVFFSYSSNEERRLVQCERNAKRILESIAARDKAQRLAEAQQVNPNIFYQYS